MATAPQPSDVRVNLWKYFAWFAGSTVVMGVLFAVISMIAPSVNTGAVGMLVPLFAANFAVDNFVKDHGRVLNSAEKWWLIWWSFGFSLLLSALTLAAAFASDEFPGADGMGWFIPAVAIVTIVLTFALVWFGYAWFPKRALRRHQKIAERKAAKGR